MQPQDERGYQRGFWGLSEKVRDPGSRERKARKILRTLQRHANGALASARGLDLGCSSGEITRVLAPYLRSLTGLEYDELALRMTDPAQRAAGRFVQGDAMALPFGDAAFDVIICAQVYEHVPDDKQLVEEIYRVLSPGGMVFFSGPNWLFPVELHYSLPFVHWLPPRLADRYLQVAGRGDHYYERARHLWGLRKLLRQFVIQDITAEVLYDFYLAEAPGWRRIGRVIPGAAWRLLLPWLPNFNFLLYKPKA